MENDNKKTAAELLAECLEEEGVKIHPKNDYAYGLPVGAVIFLQI